MIWRGAVFGHRCGEGGVDGGPVYGLSGAQPKEGFPIVDASLDPATVPPAPGQRTTASATVPRDDSSPARTEETPTMQYRRLGNTGLKVSRLALGCMSYGDPTTARAHRWALDDDAAQPFLRQAIELGITFWDTANTYQHGTSEEVVGRAIKRYSRREDIVLATKVHGTMHDGPGGQGLSRKAILEQVDASLTRLGTDFIDLYQIHRFDPDTPVEETMEALHDIVKAGKVRYLGASSMYAWQFGKLQHAADLGAGPASCPYDVVR
jgi:aryl-alcohol dehydrogenase-like predicted oxidoreductase